MTWPDLASLAQTAGQAVFGEAVIYTPKGGGVTESMTGIFDGAAKRVALADGIEIETTVPVLSMHLEDFLVAPEHGATVLVRSAAYSVIGVEPDGQGDVDLVLEKP